MIPMIENHQRQQGKWCAYQREKGVLVSSILKSRMKPFYSRICTSSSIDMTFHGRSWYGKKYYKNRKLPSHIKKCLSVERQPQKPFQIQGNDSGRGTMWKQHFILTGQLEHPKPKNDLKELYSFAKKKAHQCIESTKP
jgi:hypothetical protein